ncbi:MAG: hypothetical protein KDB61_15275, partial [Planctomycetes bacterium]|nr:hypothetical protein [Planctomycetota bacterium]
MEFLRNEGVEGEAAQELWRITQGHPLALRLALSGEGIRVQRSEVQVHATEIIHDVAMYFLHSEKDPFLREAIEATSTVRRVTQPILSAMLERPISSEEYDHLSASPIIEVHGDGLSLHRSVRTVIADWLRSADPYRFSHYRRAAWEILRSSSHAMVERDHWRHTADLIYLIDDPVIREAFFPSAAPAFS